MIQTREQEIKDRIELTQIMIRSVENKCHTFKLEEEKETLCVSAENEDNCKQHCELYENADVEDFNEYR